MVLSRPCRSRRSVGQRGLTDAHRGHSAGLPPFETRQEGELVGFDVDIAEAVFGELGYEHEFQKTSFDSIIPSLNNGNFRVIMSAMTITDERDKAIDFSDPYYRSNRPHRPGERVVLTVVAGRPR